MIIVYVLTTHNLFAPDFILLRLKNLNKDIKFIEKFYFILRAVSLADKALSITLPRSQFFLQQ